jgi:hypothetical protein
MPPGRIRPAANARAPRTSAPASATHTGSTPNSDDTPNPTSVSPSAVSANVGVAISPFPGRRLDVDRHRVGRQVARNQIRNTRYSIPTTISVGSAITAA